MTTVSVGLGSNSRSPAPWFLRSSSNRRSIRLCFLLLMRNMRNLDLAFNGMKLPGSSCTMVIGPLFSLPWLELQELLVGEKSQESSEALNGEVALVTLLLEEKIPAI